MVALAVLGSLWATYLRHRQCQWARQRLLAARAVVGVAAMVVAIVRRAVRRVAVAVTPADRGAVAETPRAAVVVAVAVTKALAAKGLDAVVADPVVKVATVVAVANARRVQVRLRH